MGDGPPPVPTDYRGRTFGKYEIIEEISRGAMGVVYKASEPLTRRIVALKVLLAGEMASGSQVERFRREVQAAARLRHPGIVPVHDVGIFDGKHYYTMDFIEGRPLNELIASGEVSIRDALDLVAEVATALDYAHGEGVIHRDVKPSNIIVDPRGKPHVMDFGLAKLVDSDDRFTRTGTTVGTPSYMPPEQASGESHHVDHRADIYSLGAVLYEMLTGRPPFSGDTMVSTLMQVLNDEPVPPKRLNPRIHHDIQTIVLKAMEKKPDRRYLHARAMADDIRHFVTGESIVARPASFGYRCWKTLRKNRSAVFAIAAVLVVALAAYASLRQLRRETVQQVERAHEAGKLEGAKDAAAKLRKEEEPTLKEMFSDEFDDEASSEQWQVETGPWKSSDGRLQVQARSLSAIHTKKKFTGNVTVIVDIVLPAQGKRPPGSAGLVGCFLGSDWRHSYRLSLGVRGPWRLSLMNQREEVAGVECPPLEPDTLYRIRLRRTSIGLHVSLEQPGDEMTQELAYRDVHLPRLLGREFSAGLFAERAGLAVERLRVEQEFLALKTGPLQTPEELYRVGNYFEARDLYEKIAQGHEGRYEGLAALVGMARCDEVQNRFAAALESLKLVESSASTVEHEHLAELLADARLHRFFCSASLNNFTDAVQALRRIADEDEGDVDPAWVWHFPRRVAELINNRAYDETLEALSAAIFGPERRTLYGICSSLRAPMLQSTLASRTRELAEALCDNGHSNRVKDVYAAFPTPLLADAFARAVEDALRSDERDESMSLLAFCTAQKMSSARLAQAAVNLGGSLCDAGLHARLAELCKAFPDARLAAVFVRGIRETTDAEQLDEAFALLKHSSESFPEETGALVASDGAAIRLGQAMLAHDDLLAPIKLHGALGEGVTAPSLVSLFVEATQAALAAREADAAIKLLAHGRAHFGVGHAGLGAAAARLVARMAADGEYAGVVAAHQAYPSESLAPALAKVIAEAVAAQRMDDALDVFGEYASSRYSAPPALVGALTTALAALDPAADDTRALLARYQVALQAYDAPTGRGLAVALGDAYVAGDRLLPALAQYESAGGMEGLMRAGCVAAELGLGERALSLWADLRKLAQPDGHWTAVATFLLGETTTGEFERGAREALFSPSGMAYLRGLRLWLTDASGAAEEMATAARGKPDWFTPLARRVRGSDAIEEPPRDPDD
ncbi:serine/threonine protein kinase, partial [bacterium]|nr:serine/threonine protein kinase [bacterium]